MPKDKGVFPIELIRHMAFNQCPTLQGARVQRAAELSPGRKPGVTAHKNVCEPADRGTEDFRKAVSETSFAPAGAPISFSDRNSGLTPGATFYRRLRRLIETPIPNRLIARALFTFFLLVLPLSFCFEVHTQNPQANRGVIRLKVRYKSEQGMKDLPRKRFFLIKGSLEQNKSLLDKIRQTEVTSRECYYRAKGASPGFIKWLKDNDCESPYCREVEDNYISGSSAVAEFQAAFEQASREVKDRELARRWLTNYLSPDLRFGFYDQQQKAIRALIAEAEAATKSSVMSIMTDRKGTAYLTNIEPNTYTISNLIGSEAEKTNILWICEREVKAIDLGIAMKRPLMLSNEKDPKVKCEIVERPLPVCN